MAIAVLVFIAAGGAASAAQPQRLTHDGQLKFAPVFTAAGTEIVFSVHNVPNRVSLLRLSLSDGSRQLVHPMVSEHQFDAAFSADGRYHCFAMSASSPQTVLVIKDALEKKQWEFRPQGARSTVRTPRITPDGRRVIFTLSAPGGQQIASVDIQGKDLKMLTQSPGTNGWPSVSPDGRKIAFSSSRLGSFNIYVMSIDGEDVKRLTNSSRRDLHPAFSPDGRRIAFTSARDGNEEIYLIGADGSSERRLTHNNHRDTYPTWHPDGRRLLMVAQRNGQCDLYLIEVP